MIRTNVPRLLSLVLASVFATSAAHATPTLIAIGTLNGTTDLSGLTGALENGLAGNVLGGIGSGLAWAGGNTFIATPDRGPNATPYNAGVDDTTSYIARFQTLNFALTAATGGALPYTLTPTLTGTTLLSSPTALTYGSGAGLGLPNGAPPINTAIANYFTGRSDNFDVTKTSTNPNNGRLDPEAVRVSRDGKSVFISDEYAYLLTTGSGVSEIVAINNHEFLVDERDGKGLGDGSVAVVKQLFRINLTGAADVGGLTGSASDQIALKAAAVPKTLVLDLVNVLNANGITSDQIPSKIEGLAFGDDLMIGGALRHTLFVANDNDFIPGTAGGNKFFVFALSDAALGATFAPQQIAEPQSLGLMLLGLGAIGFVTRRKSQGKAGGAS